jgi:hypothetical protein
LGCGATFRSRGDEFCAELVRGYNAVVKNGDDIWLGREEAEGSCVVPLTDRRLDDDDAQMLVALGEASACGVDVGFCVTRDGAVAVEDQIAVWNEAGGVDLGGGKCGGQEEQSCNRLQLAGMEYAGTGTVDVRL